MPTHPEKQAQMAALDAAIAGAGAPMPAPAEGGTVQCQVCNTTIDTVTGEPVGPVGSVPPPTGGSDPLSPLGLPI